MIWIPMTANDRLDTRLPIGFATHPPRLQALHDKVFTRPRIKAYSASGRRLAFNNEDIFRHYRELDA
jgi:glutathione S-transferase